MPLQTPSPSKPWPVSAPFIRDWCAGPDDIDGFGHVNNVVYIPVESKARILSGVVREFFDTVLEMKGPLPTAAFHDSKMLSEEEWLELDHLLNESGDDD